MHKPDFSLTGTAFRWTTARNRAYIWTVNKETAERRLVREEPIPLLRVFAGMFALAPAAAGAGFADGPALNVADAWLE